MSSRNALEHTFDASALKREFPGLADADLHYLDNAATAQMPDVVLSALRRFELEARANVHEVVQGRARAATEAYREARARVARFLNANSPEEVIFSYGATSSINVLAYAWGTILNAGDEILLSMLEHHSNLVPWQELAKRRGVVLRFLPMTDDGRLNIDRLEVELTGRCRLVALTHCSNVTGALTDVARVVAAARAVSAKIMLDGAQRAPHGPLDVRKLDVDFYAFSGHKTYGPTGIGVLWGRRELLDAMPPLMTGGQMIDLVTPADATFRPPPRRFEAARPRSPRRSAWGQHWIGCWGSTGAEPGTRGAPDTAVDRRADETCRCADRRPARYPGSPRCHRVRGRGIFRRRRLPLPG